MKFRRTSEKRKVESLVSGSDTLEIITGSRFVVLRSQISILEYLKLDQSGCTREL